MPLVLTLHRARAPADRQRESRTLDEGSLTIGRGPGNGWVLLDPAQHLSKTHCVVSSAPGGYVLQDADGPRQATLIATGSEVAVAMEARRMLAEAGIAAAVVSLPCWELFALQSDEYRAGVLGQAPRFGVEAACGFGWERWIGTDGTFIGMTGYGASAPAADLFRHFGITPEAITTAVKRRLIPQEEDPNGR